MIRLIKVNKSLMNPMLSFSVDDTGVSFNVEIITSLYSDDGWKVEAITVIRQDTRFIYV